jgi:hypothetical protein
MWPFNKKPKLPAKFCSRCGCIMELQWRWISDSYWRDILDKPSKEFDTQTGLGTALQGSFNICPRWAYSFAYHDREFLKETRRQEIINDCT